MLWYPLHRGQRIAYKHLAPIIAERRKNMAEQGDKFEPPVLVSVELSLQ